MKTAWRFTLMAMLVLATVLSACGSSGGGGGGGGGEDEFPDSADASSEDAEGTTFPLREGRYRLSYRAPGCTDVVITITGSDGTAIYDQRPRGFSSFINDVPADTYTIAVTSPDCDEWSIDLDEF